MYAYLFLSVIGYPVAVINVLERRRGCHEFRSCLQGQLAYPTSLPVQFSRPVRVRRTLSFEFFAPIISTLVGDT